MTTIPQQVLEDLQASASFPVKVRIPEMRAGRSEKGRENKPYAYAYGEMVDPALPGEFKVWSGSGEALPAGEYVAYARKSTKGGISLTIPGKA